MPARPGTSRSASRCGYHTNCPRSYTAAELVASADADCATAEARDAAAERLRAAHERARAACELGAGVLKSGGWCLTSGAPNVALSHNQSYFLPRHHGVADAIVAGVLTRLLRRPHAADRPAPSPAYWSLADFGAGVGQYGHALLSLDPEHQYRGYDGAGNAEEVRAAAMSPR